MVTLKAALANSANVGDIVGTGNFTGKKTFIHFTTTLSEFFD